jgi:hypothetical protein
MQLVLWVKHLRQQHEQQHQGTGSAATSSPPVVPAKPVSPLSALAHLSSKRASSLPHHHHGPVQPPAESIKPPPNPRPSLLDSSASASRSPSVPPTSPNVLIRNEFNLFSDTFSTPSALSSASTSFAAKSPYLDGPPSPLLRGRPSKLGKQQQQQQQRQQEGKVRYRANEGFPGSRTMAVRQGEEDGEEEETTKEEQEGSVDKEGEEKEKEKEGEGEDLEGTEEGGEELFTASSPPATSTFYLIDTKGPGKDVSIQYRAATRERRDRSTSNHIKDGKVNGPADARVPLCGWLHKSGNTFMSTWKRRYFVLDASERAPAQPLPAHSAWGGKQRGATAMTAMAGAGAPMKQALRLYYYLSKGDPVPKGFIDLALLDEIRPGVRYKNTFAIVIANRYPIYTKHYK